MAKATTIKEAIAKFEEKDQKKASETEVVKLFAQYPPIEKMDASLSTLGCCIQLSLSTNCIEKIANLNGLKCLKILSLARNNIKSLTGLEAVSETLEQLWMSYNNLEKLKGVNVLKKLKIFYFSNNMVKDVQELDKLKDLPCLEELLVVGNPFAEGLGEDLQDTVTRKLPNLKKLDGVPLVRQEQEQEQQEEV